MTIRKQALLLAVAALAGVSTVAAPFANGGFETNNCGSLVCTFGGLSPTPGLTLANWTLATGLPSAADVELVNNSFWAAAGGSWSVDLNGFAPGGIQQTFDTIVGNVYQVGFSYTGNPDLPAGIRTGTVSANGNLLGTYSLDTNTITNRTTISGMQWTAASVLFTATGTSSTLTFGSSTGGNKGLVIDSVSVNNLGTVPEPASLLFVGAGILLVGMKRFRKV